MIIIKSTLFAIMTFPFFPLQSQLATLPTFNQPSTEFVCENEGEGMSAIDALEASGHHSVFLQLLEEHDPEGYGILADPALADKTIWAPVDDALDQLKEEWVSISSEDIKKILGFHISPPLSRPNGVYPIITFDYLAEKESIVYRTRTGVLTGTEQRITSTYENGVYKIQDITILNQARCTQAGSVFSINGVITDVALPSWWVKLGYQLERTLLYDDIRFVIYSTFGGLVFGSILALLVSKRKRKEVLP